MNPVLVALHDEALLIELGKRWDSHQLMIRRVGAEGEKRTVENVAFYFFERLIWRTFERYITVSDIIRLPAVPLNNMYQQFVEMYILK